MTESTPAIAIRDLQFQYSPKKPKTLGIADLQIRRGEHAFLYGPSGSGKTTLLGLMTGILKPTAGELYVLGEPFHTLSASAKDRVRALKLGYIFQMFNLIPYLTAKENILVPYWLHHERFKNAQNLDERVFSLASDLGIEHLLDEPVTSLSVGQQQRVAAARALIGDPELIVADEPTSALDTDHRESFLKTLFNQCTKAGATLVFVSHDRSLMDVFSRKINLLDINNTVGQK
jgi:putative ABC transport system ATP-binding protein